MFGVFVAVALLVFGCTLVLRPGIELGPLAVRAPSPDDMELIGIYLEIPNERVLCTFFVVVVLCMQGCSAQTGDRAQAPTAGAPSLNH